MTSIYIVMLEATNAGFSIMIEPRAGKWLVHLTTDRHGNHYVFNKMIEQDKEQLVAAIKFVQLEIEKTFMANR